MRLVPLKEMAKVDISNVDKKAKDGEEAVLLCNFVDVYHNWAITKELVPTLMKATANESQIERFSIHKGQVAITKDSETRDDIGVPTYIADDIENGVLGYHCALITPDETELRGKYLNIVLHSPYAQKYFEANASGSGQRYTLTNEIIEGFPVPVPDDISIQDDFGKLCSEIDSKISNNTAICSDLEAMAKLLYDYWFVQFDFPDENGKPYKSSGGKIVWNDELKREIPAGWEVKPLSDLCSFMNGINYDKNEVGNKKYRIVNVRNITASSLLLDDSDFDEIVLKSSQAERYLIADSDILIARSGTPGATRLLLNNDGNTIFCGFIIRCAPNDVALRYYLTYVLKRLEGTTATKTGGSILQNVSQDTLGRVMVIVPNETITDSFTKRIEGLHSLMQNAMIENQQLASLRDFLLPMLMNGQVKVADN